MRYGPVLAAACASVLLAAPHRPTVYPNSSIAILAMTEGPQRLLWLAAQDGLYRFDGLHYQRIAGYPLASARFLASSSDGSIWIAGDEGLVRYRDAQFRVMVRDKIAALAEGDGYVIVKTQLDDWKIGIDGSIRRLGFGLRGKDRFLWQFESFFQIAKW